VETASAFFARRAQGGSLDRLDEILGRVPARTPDPEDETGPENNQG
jgi:hypothetical protein